MARTYLVQQLLRILAEGRQNQEPLTGLTQPRLTRREFVGRSLSLGAAAVVPYGLLKRGGPPPSAAAPVIAVVGAGLAGLTAAYRLAQKGYRAMVYEAAEHPGGRCRTRRGQFRDGQVAEHGGELIDSGHLATKQLAQELGLKLDSLLRAERQGTEPLYHFDGAPYSYREAGREMQAIWQKIHRDVSEAGYPTTYSRYTERGLQLDRMSITDWIQESVPGGMASRLGRLLDVAYTIEFGAECADQSALNLLYLLGYHGQGQLHIFGPSDEKYHVRGGNEQIVARLADALPGQIQLGHRLEAIRMRPDGRCNLAFQTGAGSREVNADKVILTIPFAVLRSAVDIGQAGFSPRKRLAIAELGMGSNAKLHLQFTARHWEELGCNGDTYADTGYQCTWDVSRAQPGESGLLVNYTGGSTADSYGGADPAALAQQFLAQAEPVLPGLTARWNGLATVDHWVANPYTRGSYSYWRVGQYTRFAGVEGEREGNCHFAGEHTSVDYQGYLNGAVDSGERAAGEILADLKGQKPR